jgi:uncharacterized protein YihD (DUF1040 family)
MKVISRLNPPIHNITLMNLVEILTKYNKEENFQGCFKHIENVLNYRVFIENGYRT